MSMAIEKCVAGSSSQVPEEDEDACSICLEPFCSTDPSTVTKCKHEYHLHCILEWSQRSKECPVCCQLLELSDPTSQELLAATGSERDARLSCNIRQIHEVPEVIYDAPFINDSDYEERIMRHFAAHYHQRLRRQTYPGAGSSQILPSVPTADQFNLEQTDNQECLIIGDRYSVSSAEFSTSSEFPSVTIGESSNVSIKDCLCKPSPPPLDSSRRSSSPDMLAFSDSIKSKFSAASARCKESISKGTRGLKEKLLARKQLSRDIQREMNASIAGVAKMIERLDLSSKRTGGSALHSTCEVETPNLENKGKGVQGNTFAQKPNQNIYQSPHSSTTPPLLSNTIFSHPEVSLSQSRE